MEKRLDEIQRNCRLIKGYITRCILNTRTVNHDERLKTSTIIEGERLKRVAFGEKNESKPYKTILMLGESGVDKSIVINGMVNYMLGVSSEDRFWCEITDTEEYKSDSQTKAITVYDMFPEHSSFSLSVIDLHGYGSPEDSEEQLKFAECLREVFESVNEIDALLIVQSSAAPKFTERQLNIFDTALSLFDSAAEKNIAVLITHDKTMHPDGTEAFNDGKILFGKTKQELPCFQFYKFHSENLNDKQILDVYKASLELLRKHMDNFLTFLKESKSVKWKKYENILRQHDQLTARIYNLKDRITLTDLRIVELQQLKEAIEQYDKDNGDMGTFKCGVNIPYKQKVPLPYKWSFIPTTAATCCKVCEENCHYPGCWWATHPSHCSVMSDDGKCLVCTGKCHYTDHVKEPKIYEVNRRKVKKTMEDLKRKYKTESGENLVSKLEKEIKEQEKERKSLVKQCCQCAFKLNEITSEIAENYFVSLLTDPQITDFLIFKAHETEQLELVQQLKELKNTANATNINPLGFLSS